MKTETSQENSKQAKKALLWLLPSWSEVVIYSVLVAITFISTNIDSIKNYLSIPIDFYFHTIIIDFINGVIERLVGREIAASAASGFFFGLAGLIIYSVVWLLANFSTEVHNDLAVTKYVHPNNVDTKSGIRDFISKTIFRLSVVLILVFYIALWTKSLMPYWADVYQRLANNWFSLEALWQSLLAIFAQSVALHLFVILARLIFLKKRLFFAEDYHN